MEAPWDDISIQYVLVCTHVAKKRYVEAFKEESQLVSCVLVAITLLTSINIHCLDSSYDSSLRIAAGHCLRCFRYCEI